MRKLKAVVYCDCCGGTGSSEAEATKRFGDTTINISRPKGWYENVSVKLGNSEKTYVDLCMDCAEALGLSGPSIGAHVATTITAP